MIGRSLMKQESEARSQEPEEKRIRNICRSGLHLIILDSDSCLLAPVFTALSTRSFHPYADKSRRRGWCRHRGKRETDRTLPTDAAQLLQPSSASQYSAAPR